MIGQIANLIKRSLKRAKYKGNIFDSGINTMRDVVEITFKNSKKGDIVLLSPASASFGMFKDYKDRGDQFREFVEKLWGILN